MLYTKVQSIEAIKNIAHALSDLNEQVVFVGGAVVGLYANDPGAPEVRPTKDIDIVFEIGSVFKLKELRQKLAKRGIHFAKDEEVMCRFIFQNTFLDIMATKEIDWAPSNPWFKFGFEYPETVHLDELKIKILPVEYYLASKFTAFRDRGNDPRTSPDIDDIVYILDNRKTLVKDILESKKFVKEYLFVELKAFLDDTTFQEVVIAHLEPATQTERYEMLIQKLSEILR
ncbi:MAG: hypothetical protein KAT07_13825 [Calditrichia bacterium]|nr:hypothetical protein [Calditrichia bacterium]